MKNNSQAFVKGLPPPQDRHIDKYMGRHYERDSDWLEV
jgi:hypothetical protein